jgi:hypothetical protein
MDTEPQARFATAAATKSVSSKLNWRHENGMQDWPLEVSHEINISEALATYDSSSEDEKFVIMEGLLYALDEVEEKSDFNKFSLQIGDLLERDFSLHEYTIYYWTLYGSENVDEFNITPLCREIWKTKKTTTHNN